MAVAEDFWQDSFHVASALLTKTDAKRVDVTL
ncbi:hypothetical protein MY3296_002917 [Beauveria thailandica]